MEERSATPKEQAQQLDEGDDFQWIGEGWTDNGPRLPNRATVQNIHPGTDHEERDAYVIEIEGVRGGEAELYLYDDRDDVILYGSAKTPEQIVEIHHSTE